MFSKLPTHLIYKLFSIVFILGIMLLPINKSFAQQGPAPGVSGVVKSINGSMVECTGGITIDLSQADLEGELDDFKDEKLSDIKVGTVIHAEGQVVLGQNSQTRTILKATNATIIPPQQIIVAAPIQKIDPERKTITLLNREILVDGQTALFQRKKKKNKPTTFVSLGVGQKVTVDVILQDDGSMVAKKAVQGLYPGNISPIVVGLVEKVEGVGILTLKGGFHTDVTNLIQSFPYPLTVTDGILAQITVPEIFATTTQDPYMGSGFGFGRKGTNLTGAFEKVDLVKQTVTVLGREVQVTAQTKFEGYANLKSLADVKLGAADSGVDVEETSSGLVATVVYNYAK